MALIEIQVPDIGDFDAVTVIELLVKPGDTVQAEQSLITVESDKASMEIPSSHAGVVKELRVQIGDQVKQGSVVLALEVAEGAAAAPAAAPAPAPASAPDSGAASAGPATVSAPKTLATAAAQAPAAPALVAASAAAPVPAHQPTAAPTGKLPHASPSVRKFARELGVPLAEVKGTGPKGRITQADVQAFTQSVMAGSLQTQAQAAKAPAASAGTGAGLDLLPWPKVDFAKFGAVERKELSRIKKISGANLHRNWVMIPHVTNNDEADITELEAFRVSTNKENEKSGVKVTMLAFVIKAVVAALKKFPEFNASLDGDTLVYKQYFHIGFAA
ncbi:MAG: 2-oxo acid dehydrogenase subunit E2, partial [Simplicispira sp.]|uniref:2-oxo acid dehydrogenase subunit E2 n=1 Tax=Simplicispira sp. TaxID=2015802 RepID=UPI002589A9C5